MSGQPYVVNPVAIGDPGQTPIVALPGWDPPCSDCVTWDAQLMFNGIWAAVEPCDRHRGEPIEGLPGLSMAPTPSSATYGFRHDASGCFMLPLADDADEARRLIDVARPHLVATDWTVERSTLLDDEEAAVAYRAAKAALAAASGGPGEGWATGMGR